MKKSKLLLLLLMILIIGITLMSCDWGNKYEGVTDVDFAVIWNGLSSIYPQSETDNPVAAHMREKTNVNMKLKFYDGFENDNLMRLFSVGKNMPDVIMAPYWGGGDPNSATIRQAVRDGLLVSVDEFLEEYAPNLKNAWTNGVAQSFIDLELTHKDFDGKKYIIPMQTPASDDDTTNWGYTVYARKDILSSLAVEPSSIHTSNDVYELATKIKAGNFKDKNGNNIITASTFAYGWSYETYLNSFKTRINQTNVRCAGDGTLSWVSQSQHLKDEIVFMNNMINNGLFDKTAFTHGQAQVLQKHITGGVGLTSTIYYTLRSTLKNTLYVTNPEMEYVPLGPIVDANGDSAMPGTFRQRGEYGFPVLLITKDCKNVEAVMRYLNYINSEEGRLVATLGIFNEDWMYDEGGKIIRTPQFLEQEAKDPNYEVKRGIAYHYLGVSQVPNAKIGNALYANDETYAKVMSMYPTQLIEGTLASSFDLEFPQIEYFRNILNAMNYQTTIESAYCAKNNSDALTILNNYNYNLDSRGYLTAYLAWLTNRLKDEVNIIF